MEELISWLEEKGVVSQNPQDLQLNAFEGKKNSILKELGMQNSTDLSLKNRRMKRPMNLAL